MIRLQNKKHFYTYERIVFADKAIESNADIVRYMRYRDSNMIEGIISEEYITLITDLSLPHEEIFAGYDSKLRNQIRRAYKEKIDFCLYDKLSVENDYELLSRIRDEYYRFCESINEKRLKYNLQWDEFLLYVRNGNLFVSKAEYDGGWVYHIYQIDRKSAMLWFSFSDYRTHGVNKQLAGWANRALHDQDILFFQQHGFKEYDWGNISSVNEPNDIDKFKMSFGGKIEPVYCGFVANNSKGRMLLKFRKLRKLYG